MKSKYKLAHLTKPWVILLFCAIILIGYILIWLLLADANLLHLQWLIPYHGQEWSGKINSNNASSVFNAYKSEIIYWAAHPTKSDIPPIIINNVDDFVNYVNQYFAGGIEILSIAAKFNALILIPIILLLAVAIIIPLILKFFKWMQIDVIIFSVSISLSAIVFIMSGLIPHTFGISWIWLIRIIITMITLTVIFLGTNRMINYFLGNSVAAEQAIVDITTSERDRNASRKTLNELKDQYRKEDNLTHIEIDKDN